jgi:hypothetical protein
MPLQRRTRLVVEALTDSADDTRQLRRLRGLGLTHGEHCSTDAAEHEVCTHPATFADDFPSRSSKKGRPPTGAGRRAAPEGARERSREYRDRQKKRVSIQRHVSVGPTSILKPES